VLTLISVYSPIHPDIFKESHNTLWICTYQGDQALRVVDVKAITSIVTMPHLPGHSDSTVFIVEKPGLDVAHLGGQDEILADE